MVGEGLRPTKQEMYIIGAFGGEMSPLKNMKKKLADLCLNMAFKDFLQVNYYLPI
jgi:flavorubredoxin